MKNINAMGITDSYKLSHAPQYPDGTEYVRSYFEPRVGAKFDKTVFFGLQYIIKEYLVGKVVTEDWIDRMEWITNNHVGPNIFNREGWDYILKEHDGKLPIEIRAVPEGTPVPTSNVLMTVVNTDPKCFWLTNYLETLLVQVWYPCTVASLSYEAKKMLLRHLVKSGTPENIDFMLHDFGVRGSTTPESAALGGLGHLINFKGTDNIPALIMGYDYYECDMAGFSVAASEHSTVTSHGQENELQTYIRYFRDVYPSGIAACVADSWNVYEAAKMWSTGDLKDIILNRDGKAVFRPDSGEPKEVDPEVINILGKGFGFTTNDKGYNVLPTDKIGVIQGDGCNLTMMNEVLCTIEDEYNQSSDNIIFGMGGALLQKLDRDTQRFAFKCSEITVNGETRNVSKDPITDKGKKSKAGNLHLVREGDKFFTIPGPDGAIHGDILETVFKNGEITKEYTFDQIRQNAQ